MPKQRKIKNRDAYELFWKALSLNDDYRAFCEWRRENPFASRSDIPQRFFKPGPDLCPAWDKIYKRFGDIFQTKFEDWAEDYFVNPFANMMPQKDESMKSDPCFNPYLVFLKTGLRRLQAGDVKKCLTVYELHNKGLSPEQIIKKIGAKTDKEKLSPNAVYSERGEDPKKTILRMYRRYRQKGKRISDNALWNCNFPDLR